MILVRALYRDFSRYNRVATDEEKAEEKEETGWKLVHADVFRPPAKHPMLFAVFVGTGSQVRAPPSLPPCLPAPPFVVMWLLALFAHICDF